MVNNIARPPARPLAPHVRAAIAGSAQPRIAGLTSGARIEAPHVKAALAHTARELCGPASLAPVIPVVQPKLPPRLAGPQARVIQCADTGPEILETQRIMVPIVSQGGNNNLCWAACVCMILRHRRGDARTRLSDVNDHFGGIGQSGSSGMAKLYLESKGILSRDLSTINLTKILEALQRGNPVLLSYAGMDAESMGHMVVAVGFVKTTAGITYRINDPAEVTEQTFSQAELGYWDSKVLEDAIEVL